MYFRDTPVNSYTYCIHTASSLCRGSESCWFSIAVPTIAPIVKNLVQYVATDGVLFLLKKYAGMVAVQQFSKWVPLVGQIIAPSIGFGLTMAVGSACLNDCHKIAEAILQKELEKMNK